VATEDDQVLEATLRGKFRLQDLDTTNPVAVGDRVRLELPPSGAPVIVDIAPRQNYILRKATKSGSQVQMLAANIDQAVLVASIAQPFTALGYIDRFLVMCEAYGISARILWNKVDLLRNDADRNRLADFALTYQDAGYPVTALSALNPDHLERLRAIFAGKRSFLAGPSGVGKSSVANALVPGLGIKTRELVKQTQKGRHTTTYAELHPLPPIAGEVIDAPGFREFDLVGITAAELGHFFPEFRQRLGQCRYHNCLHQNEPDCAIKAAYEAGQIAHTRYHTYSQMLLDLQQPTKHR
jgi:ribosome biogenesis GTPase